MDYLVILTLFLRQPLKMYLLSQNSSQLDLRISVSRVPCVLRGMKLSMFPLLPPLLLFFHHVSSKFHKQEAHVEKCNVFLALSPRVMPALGTTPMIECHTVTSGTFLMMHERLFYTGLLLKHRDQLEIRYLYST